MTGRGSPLEISVETIVDRNEYENTQLAKVSEKPYTVEKSHAGELDHAHQRRTSHIDLVS